MSKNYHIAVLPGDGIGPEVMAQALKVLDAIRNRFDMGICTSYYNVGGIVSERDATPLPQAVTATSTLPLVTVIVSSLQKTNDGGRKNSFAPASG